MINTKTKGELGRRIEYDVEHDLFHPQNIYSDEYITPTFVEYVQKLEKEIERITVAYNNCARDNYYKTLDLEKENAELKDKLNKIERKCRFNFVDLLHDVENESKQEEQLTKAKELLKEFNLVLKERGLYHNGLYKRTEQFLKDNA